MRRYRFEVLLMRFTVSDRWDCGRIWYRDESGHKVGVYVDAGHWHLSIRVGQ